MFWVGNPDRDVLEFDASFSPSSLPSPRASKTPPIRGFLGPEPRAECGSIFNVFGEEYLEHSAFRRRLGAPTITEASRKS